MGPELGLHTEALVGWPALETLSLRDNFQLEPEVGTALRHGCPELRTVDLHGCRKIDDTTVAELLGLKHLRSLDLSRCPRVTEQCLPLLVAATQLEEIRLDDTDWLTLDAAEKLFASGKRVVARKQNDPAFAKALAGLAERYSAHDRQPR